MCDVWKCLKRPQKVYNVDFNAPMYFDWKGPNVCFAKLSLSLSSKYDAQSIAFQKGQYTSEWNKSSIFRCPKYQGLWRMEQSGKVVILQKKYYKIL